MFNFFLLNTYVFKGSTNQNFSQTDHQFLLMWNMNWQYVCLMIPLIFH